MFSQHSVSISVRPWPQEQDDGGVLLAALALLESVWFVLLEASTRKYGMSQIRKHRPTNAAQNWQ